MTSFLIQKLARHHALDAFDCGHEALNRFLLRFALSNQLASASQTYEHFDFEPSPTDPLHLFVLVKDLRRAAAGT